MKLTIVLTVYNKEPFLRRALDALLNQENTKENDYEVLAVNDGSTDGSAAILEEYAAKDSRVRILTQDNQGLSMARNNGVKAAKGEYVWFVDADDTISAKAVRFICDATQEHPDVIPIYARTEGVERVRNAVSPDAKTGKDILLGGHWEQCGVFWVLRKNFLKENNLQFMPGVYHEDAEFTPRMLYAAQNVKVVPEVLYTVYREQNSITTTPYAKRAFDCLTVAESLSRFVVEKGETETVVGRVIYSCASLLINNGLAVIVQNSKEEQDRMNQIFFEKKQSLLRSLRSALPRKYRMECLLLSVFPRHAVWVYKVLKAI